MAYGVVFTIYYLFKQKHGQKVIYIIENKVSVSVKLKRIQLYIRIRRRRHTETTVGKLTRTDMSFLIFISCYNNFLAQSFTLHQSLHLYKRRVMQFWRPIRKRVHSVQLGINSHSWTPLHPHPLLLSFSFIYQLPLQILAVIISHVMIHDLNLH